MTAACLTASLAAGAPATVPDAGHPRWPAWTARRSRPTVWPELRAGIHGTVTVEDAEARAAMRELAAAGLTIGDCGAAPLAGAARAGRRPFRRAPPCARRSAWARKTRVVLIATEGPTDPDGYARATVASRE